MSCVRVKRLQNFVNMLTKRSRLNVFSYMEHVLEREQFTLNKSYQKVNSVD